MKTAAPVTEENMVPVDQDPLVRERWAAVLTARQTCAEAGTRLTQARDRSGRAYRELPTGLPTVNWSRREFWQARADLPQLEKQFDEMQGALEPAQAEHAEARTVACRRLEPVLREKFRPLLAARTARPQAFVAADTAVQQLAAEATQLTGAPWHLANPAVPLAHRP